MRGVFSLDLRQYAMWQLSEELCFLNISFFVLSLLLVWNYDFVPKQVICDLALWLIGTSALDMPKIKDHKWDDYRNEQTGSTLIRKCESAKMATHIAIYRGCHASEQSLIHSEIRTWAKDRSWLAKLLHLAQNTRHTRSLWCLYICGGSQVCQYHLARGRLDHSLERKLKLQALKTCQKDET